MACQCVFWVQFCCWAVAVLVRPVFAPRLVMAYILIWAVVMEDTLDISARLDRPRRVTVEREYPLDVKRMPSSEGQHMLTFAA